jgi:hypothetical protein
MPRYQAQRKPRSLDGSFNTENFRQRCILINRYKITIKLLQKKIQHLQTVAQPWLALLPTLYPAYYLQTREPLALINYILFATHNEYRDTINQLKHLLQQCELYHDNNQFEFKLKVHSLLKSVNADQSDLLNFIETLRSNTYTPLNPSQKKQPISPQRQVIHFFHKRMKKNDPLQRRETQLLFKLNYAERYNNPPRTHIDLTKYFYNDNRYA